MNTKRNGLAALGVAAVCAFALAGCSGGAQATTVVANAEHAITVTASSDVKVVPDKAQITVSVSNQANEAAECQDANASAVKGLIDALKAAGVAENSIQTTGTNLYPLRDYSSGAPSVVGYEMTTTLSVGNLEIDTVGDVIQKAVSGGATDIGGIRYYSSTYDAAYADALKAAIAAAREKAQVIASASKVAIGAIVNVTEGYQNTAYRAETGANYLYGDAAASEAAKVMPGEIAVSANVTVSFAIV